MAAIMLRAAVFAVPAARAQRSSARRAVVTRAGKCACGKTSDAAGNCDGSHAKKMCGCGKTASDKGFCDGSHANKAAPAPAAVKMCGCGKTASPTGACDGSHAKK